MTLSVRRRSALRRNRDFLLFQAGQLLSSPAARLLRRLSAARPRAHGLAGEGGARLVRARSSPRRSSRFRPASLADRLDRRRIMLASDAVRALALAALALIVWHSSPVFWPIPLLAFVEGAGDTFFGACLGGVLRSVVPPAAAPGRRVGAAGPDRGRRDRRPAGRRSAVRASRARCRSGSTRVSYAFSFAAIARDADAVPAAARARGRCGSAPHLAEGFRFLWTQTVPARDVVLLRRRQLHDPGAPRSCSSSSHAVTG